MDNLPAPMALLELSMCGCKTNCTSNRCKYLKNNLICIDMCKCENCQNIEDSSKQNDGDDDDFELSYEVDTDDGEWCIYIPHGCLEIVLRFSKYAICNFCYFVK